MHERGDVNQFHDHGKIDMCAFHFAGRSAREKREHWPQTFPATADRIRNVTFNRRIERGRLRDDAFIHFVETRPNEFGNARETTGSNAFRLQRG